MNGLEMVQGFIQRGYTPWQAAALAGHAIQESGGNPSSVNPKEDAHGLLQFRLDRWENLQKYAGDQGKSPTDPNVQMDFIKHEMTNGSESKAGAGFLAAPDVANASAALKPYIRFGDNSAGTRLANAQGLYAGLNGPVGALDANAAPAPALAPPTVLPSSPDAAPAVAAAAPPGLGSQLGALGTLLSGPAAPGAAVPASPEPALQQIQMARPSGQSQQIAAALARAYGMIQS